MASEVSALKEEPKLPTDSDSMATKALTKAEPNFANQHLDLQHLTLNQLNFIGKSMAASGMFGDVEDANKAIVKILAGQEIGVTPFQAMTNIHIIQGKATMGANLMAAKLKGSSKYDYRVPELNNESCIVEIYQSVGAGRSEKIGTYQFSMEDAQRMGLSAKDNWRKYPQAMLFARAISQAVRLYAPDIFNGNLVYTPDELGAIEDDEGNIVGTSDTATTKPAPVVEAAPDPKPQEPAEEVNSNVPLPSASQVKEVKAKFEKLGITTLKDKKAYSELNIGKEKPISAFDYNDLSAALSADIDEREATTNA